MNASEEKNTTENIKKFFYNVAPCLPIKHSFAYSFVRNARLIPGCRVLVPFGRQRICGFITESCITPEVDIKYIKPMIKIIDQYPLFPKHLWSLIKWCAKYYHYPLGKIAELALTQYHRKQKCPKIPINLWTTTKLGKLVDISSIKRAPKQRELLSQMRKVPYFSSQQSSYNQSIFTALKKKGWIKNLESQPQCQVNNMQSSKFTLTEEQKNAIKAIHQSLNQFQAFLLFGITGSGKTEVYLQCIAQQLRQHHQILLLVPEINLTPQLINHVKDRFANYYICAWHSSLTASEKKKCWEEIKSGICSIVIGTRSAIFLPFIKLGLIIIDEEHDGSLKQQDGLMYHSRDVAIQCAFIEQCPVILGSATPSLETLYNVQCNKYQMLCLNYRANCSNVPVIQLLDVRHQKLKHGLSYPLIQEIKKTLDKKEQILVFLNQRGYSRALFCPHCRWIASCQNCDIKLIWHQKIDKLSCHHCQFQKSPPKSCPICQSSDIFRIGVGTEQIEDALQIYFPNAAIARMDKDTTRQKHQAEILFKQLHDGNLDILIGTQMITKGHHFPNVTMVAIVDCDQALFSSDFRAPEKLAQQVIQVAGRAGREHKPGQVFIQSCQVDHPLLQKIIAHDYLEISRILLKERQIVQLPPYSKQALILAQSRHQDKLTNWMYTVKQKLQTFKYASDKELSILGPIPAPIHRKRNYYRHQLLIQSSNYQVIWQYLNQLWLSLEQDKTQSQIKWVADIDPLNML